MKVCKELEKKRPRCGLECWSFDSEGNNYYDFNECGAEFKEISDE